MATLTAEQQKKTVILYKEGYSASEIARQFGVGLDPVYYVLRRLKVPRRSHSENSKRRFEAKPLSFRVKENLTSGEERLKLAAVMLYWAEGYKVGKLTTVDFANSDPKMALIFRRFLSEICRVDEKRVRAKLYCYTGQNIESLTKFWSEYLGIPISQFTKPYIKEGSSDNSRGARMIHGLVHVRYCDKKLHKQVLEWIEEYQHECVGGGVVNRKGL